jgi:DNA processing protein
MEQNREVFAIPGSIHNPMSKGCHWLIKQGAKLVEHSLDIVEEVTEFQHHIAKLTSNLSAPSQTLKVRSTNSNITGLLQYIGFEITTVDKIAERSLLPINDILAQLLDMELSGEIAAVGGGYMRI